MTNNVSSFAMAGVAAVCSAVAVVSVMQLLGAGVASQNLYAPSVIATQPIVGTMSVNSVPHARLPQARLAAVHSEQAADMPATAMPNMATPADSWTFAALMTAIPATFAAIFYAVGRYASAQPVQKVAPMDVTAYGTNVAMASTTGEVSRRQLLQGATAATLAMSASPALAVAPKGFKGHKDQYDGYQFLYPFGWQEVSVDGQDVLFKDIIEPLETVGVTVTPTERTSVSELGDVQQVCFTIADNFLTTKTQQVTILDARSEESEGITYYSMEFLAKSSSGFTRHALAVLAICNGKLFTCLTGASEKRWKTMQSKLRTTIESFTVFKVIRQTSRM
jgi:photosystem II oxygen-evolving enhancer protein 2|uniref:PsbP C-terminal domain-containing protein n=1 Tax=Eutreptiella gymnastica TaxID=73025 RepID=A0A7S4FTV2_9EUGL